MKYIVYDDGGDSARHQSLVQQLVEQDHAIAIVQEDDVLTGQSSVPYINQHRIPVIGNEGGAPWQYQNATYFPSAGSADVLYRSSAAGYGEVGKLTGKTKFGIVACAEVAQCTEIANVASSEVGKYGLSSVYKGQASLTLPDYTSYCQSAKSAGAEILAVILDDNGIERFVKSCASINYHPVYTSVSILANGQLSNDPLLEGMILPVPLRPWMDPSSPAIREYSQALKQYAPGLDAGTGSELGWASAKAFELAASSLGDPPTSPAVLDGVWSRFNGIDLGGLTNPLTFTRDQPAPQVGCHWLIQIRGGVWTSPNGYQRECP